MKMAKEMCAHAQLRRAGTTRALVLRQADIADFKGDVILTSTNRRLEGVYRQNWWGFAGKKSADAAVHDRWPELSVAMRKNGNAG